MPLICPEDHPKLILKFQLSTETDPQKLGPVDYQQNGSLYKRGTIESLRKDALAAWNNYERYGSMENLEQAISKFQAVIDIMHEDDPALPTALSDFGVSILQRFEQSNGLSDLNNAITHFQRAANLMLDSHSGKPMTLNNLGNSYQHRFDRLGNINDLDSAISQRKAAVRLSPDGDPDKFRFLNNLGGSFGLRFQRYGNIADIDEAIANTMGMETSRRMKSGQKSVWHVQFFTTQKVQYSL
jgi:tetratricopeptide (TPR) repeat protein